MVFAYPFSFAISFLPSEITPGMINVLTSSAKTLAITAVIDAKQEIAAN